jgi:6,7-dimethyl-8-ribityllumazine synthase
MKKTYDSVSQKKLPGTKIAIIQSRWHNEHTDKMVAACMELLKKAECEQIEHHVVPGAYELPLAAKKLARIGNFDAIVVFGAIVKGETDHYKVILNTCTTELGKVMYEFEIPIIMELLPVHDVQDLIARSAGDNNKGIEAADAAIEMINWVKSLNKTVGKTFGYSFHAD